MSRRIRKLKRNIRDNITKIPSFESIKDGIYNTAVSAKDAAVSAKDATLSGVKKKYFGKYEDEYLNANYRDTNADDIEGSAWIKVYDVSETDKDKPDEIEKLRKIVGTDKDKINPIIHINELKLDIEKEIEDIKKNIDEEEFSSSSFNLFDDNFNENVNKKDENFNQKKAEILEQKKAELLEELITHIKEKKYTEKIGISNVSNFFNKKIVIPYSNIDENDFSVEELKDELLEKFTKLNEVYIEIKENGILNYYIQKPIKKYIRYAIIKSIKINNEKKSEKKLAKEEKQKKLDAKKNKAKELLNSIGTDILSDNKIDTFPPFSKLAYAYCYIHPFNVILYERKIMYGLKWKKVNFDPSKIDPSKIYLYVNIEEFFKDKNVLILNLIKEKFEEVYNNLSAAKGKGNVGGGTEVIDLTGIKEVRDIVYNAGYLDDFKSEKFYYIYNDNGIKKYYICKNSKLDYKYNHKSWDKEKYYTKNSIDKSGLQSNLNEIRKLNDNLTTKLDELKIMARENGEINKFKELERQDRSDERFNDNAGKFGYYTTLLFVHTAKYIQDTFLAGIKHLFITSWNNVITGFLILLFIILVIIMGVALGGGGGGGGNDGPNKKPKEENKDFISLLKSMPANINSAYADFNNFATDFGNIITNGRRAVNDFTDAITGDNTPIDSVREQEKNGRGGDNIIHYNYGTDNVISAYEPIAKIIPKQNGINSTGQITSESDFGIITEQSADGDELYKLKCDNQNISNYFTKSCKLRKDYSLDTRFIKEPESDYEQIKIND
jgi:hypothetical protein